MPFSTRKRIASFRHAFRGVSTLLRTQHNAWLHLAASAAVVALGYFLAITRGEWLAIVLALGLVWTAEALNTAVEFLADEVSLERRDLLGKAKDVGAAGVLLASASALAVGIVVFGPYLFAFLHHRHQA
jgi:diacylglycerol kinase (ATP)